MMNLERTRFYLGADVIKLQIAKLEKGNKADYQLKRVEELLKLAVRILENQEEILERELSISFFWR